MATEVFGRGLLAAADFIRAKALNNNGYIGTGPLRTAYFITVITKLMLLYDFSHSDIEKEIGISADLNSPICTSYCKDTYSPFTPKTLLSHHIFLLILLGAIVYSIDSFILQYRPSMISKNYSILENESKTDTNNGKNGEQFKRLQSYNKIRLETATKYVRFKFYFPRLISRIIYGIFLVCLDGCQFKLQKDLVINMTNGRSSLVVVPLYYCLPNSRQGSNSSSTIETHRGILNSLTNTHYTIFWHQFKITEVTTNAYLSNIWYRMNMAKGHGYFPLALDNCAKNTAITLYTHRTIERTFYIFLIYFLLLFSMIFTIWAIISELYISYIKMAGNQTFETSAYNKFKKRLNCELKVVPLATSTLSTDSTQLNIDTNRLTDRMTSIPHSRSVVLELDDNVSSVFAKEQHDTPINQNSSDTTSYHSNVTEKNNQELILVREPNRQTGIIISDNYNMADTLRFTNENEVMINQRSRMPCTSVSNIKNYKHRQYMHNPKNVNTRSYSSDYKNSGESGIDSPMDQGLSRTTSNRNYINQYKSSVSSVDDQFHPKKPYRKSSNTHFDNICRIGNQIKPTCVKKNVSNLKYLQ